MKTTNPNIARLRCPRGRGFTVVAWLVLLVALVSGARGEGFRNPPPGTFNLGRSGGRFAHIDDASAVQQNPANLADLKEAEFQLTPTVVRISADFESSIAPGQTAGTEDPWKVLPNLFGAMPLMNGRIVVGLGLTTPYGLGSDWDTTSSAFNSPMSVLRYQAPHYAELKTINGNPTVAFRIADNLTLGVGFNAMWSEVTLKQFYPWLIFPGSGGLEPDGNAHAQGDGFGFGGNVGLTWQINSKQRLAFTYRSPIRVKYSGDFTIDNVTPTAAFLGVTPASDFDTRIKFPTIVGVGYGVQVNDKFRFEISGEWIEFSNFQSLDLGVGNNALLFPSTSFAQDWKDTFTAGIGGDWKFAPNWTARFGYQYYESPVPDHTLSTTIPDANQHVLTLGIGYQHKNHSLEAGYGLDFYDTRTVANNVNPVFNGTYKINVHLFSFAYRFRF